MTILLYQVFVHGSIRWFQIVTTSQLYKCSCSGGRRGLWTATSWRKTDNKWCVRNFFWINLGFWETAHLPLPLANILHKVRTKCFCWLMGGEGGQFPGNLNWSLLVFASKKHVVEHPKSFACSFSKSCIAYSSINYCTPRKSGANMVNTSFASWHGFKIRGPIRYLPSCPWFPIPSYIFAPGKVNYMQFLFFVQYSHVRKRTNWTSLVEQNILLAIKMLCTTLPEIRRLLNPRHQRLYNQTSVRSERRLSEMLSEYHPI